MDPETKLRLPGALHRELRQAVGPDRPAGGAATRHRTCDNRHGGHRMMYAAMMAYAGGLFAAYLTGHTMLMVLGTIIALASVTGGGQ